MTDYIRPEFTPEVLHTYTGYHLQIFTSGRAKISLQKEKIGKDEFFAVLPKRDRQAYARQKARSGTSIPEHFETIDTLLSGIPDAKLYRLHEKGNNNKTADNAHLLVSLEQSTLWLVMGSITHSWSVMSAVIMWLQLAEGARTGEPSLFNEFMPTYEHDWEDMTFDDSDYKHSIREKAIKLARAAEPRTDPEYSELEF